MRFKDFFLLTEDPDDLYMGDKSALTFGFCGNFIMYFYDNQVATHWELLCLAKKNIFKLEYSDMVHSISTEDDLKRSEPYYRQIGVAPENVINFLKNKRVADIRRGTFLDAVDDGFLGRISMQHDIVSFWNSADSFSSEDKKTVERVVKLYGKDPTKMKYNFYNGRDNEDTFLKYSQFFKLAPTQTPIKAADTSHIVHGLPPEEKKEALIQMGVKPKAAKGVEARYAMGESFKDFFKESPDHSVTWFPLAEPVDGIEEESLGWRMPDARTFIVHQDFICLTNSNNVFHSGLFEYIDDAFTHGNKHRKSLLTSYGTPSVKLLSYAGPDTDREFMLRKLPECIQGRIWTEHNYISFWNKSVYVKNNLPKIIEMIKLIGGNPNEYQWELDNTDPVSLASLTNKPERKDLVNKKSTNTSDWQKVVHGLPPEEKKEALIQMGVKPKPAMGVQQRYLNGESFRFKDFFKVLTENDSTPAPNKLPDPDLSGLTETLEPKVDDNIVKQALTIANVPLINTGKLKGTNIAFLATDAHIQSRLLVSVGMGPLIEKAKIPEEKLFLYDTTNSTWIKHHEDHIVGWHNTLYAITSSVWRSIFGDYAFTQLGKTAVVVEPEQITPVATVAPQLKTLSPSEQDELIAFAIRRAQRPFIGSSMHMKNIAANGLTKNLKVIYLGIETDLVKKAKIPIDKLFYFVNGDWTDETPEEDYVEYVGMLGIDWANTFGQAALTELKEKIKEYVGEDKEKEETKTTTEGSSSTLTKNFAISRAIRPLTKPSAVPGIEFNDYAKWLWTIYVGKTNDLIEAANIDKTKLAYFVNGEWVTEEAPMGTPKGLSREEWVKVFGKESFDTLMAKIKTLKQNGDIKENVNMFTESPDHIKDRNDPETTIYYHNNEESYTVLMLTDGTPGSFVFRKDSSPQKAGHGNLRGTLRRIKDHELKPSDDINDIKSDIALDDIAQKQYDRGAYEVRVWTHNKIISYWTGWQDNLVKPTMDLLKFMGQNPEEYIYEMDSSYYDSSKADSPMCYTHEEFMTGHKDHSPEALKLKQQRFEDRQKLAQAKLGMLNKDQALRDTDVPIKGLGKAPSFYKRSGD